MPTLRTYCLFIVAVFLFTSSFSQNYTRTDTIPVKVNSTLLKNAWTGGHNFCQLSDIDINFDGIKDLFVFDRAGHKITTYINKGTPNTVDYIDSTAKYAPKFPHLEDWALIRDYNCDGKPDIFTYGITVGGIKVWKNTSTGGNLQFTLQTPYITSNYCPSVSNLYVSRVDIPSISDIDNDGDLDILTFDFTSIGVEYHINKSVELGYNCDSLIFQLDCSGGCWGNFQENPNNCSIDLAACRIMNPNPLSANTGVAPSHNSLVKKERHSGSCILCLDMDADNDKEIIIGDISCCNITLLTNGGSLTAANMIAKDTNFPSTNVPVKMNLFPCGYFLDVNNDNKRDLIVAPNAPNVSINNESIWYYKNTGTDNAPVFSRVKRNFLQDEMIETGESSDPVFFDFDTDGLTDLLISNYTMIIDSCPSTLSFSTYAFKNTGTASSPKFDLINTDFANLSSQLPSISSKHLTFGDLDADGDQDMMIGDYNGFLHYFQNTAGVGNPCTFVLTTQNYPDDSNTPIDIGSYATPQLIDADRDDDLDLIIGERAGNLNFYENIGTASAPSFTLNSIAFGGVDVMTPCCTGYSVPFMYDSLGSYRLMVSSEASRNYPETGWIWHFTNIEGNLAGNFTLVDSLYENIWEGARMTVNGKDINADGGMDLVIGNYAGGAAIYMGDSNATVLVPELNSSAFDFLIYPNPSSSNISIHIKDFDSGKKPELLIYTTLGELVYRQKIIAPNSTLPAQYLSTGVYSCIIKSNNYSVSKKLILLK